MTEHVKISREKNSGTKKKQSKKYLNQPATRQNDLPIFSMSMNLSTLLERSSNPTLLKDQCINRRVLRVAKYLITWEKELQIPRLVVQDPQQADWRFVFKRCNSACHKNLTILSSIQIHIFDMLNYMKTPPDHWSFFSFFFFEPLDFKVELRPLLDLNLQPQELKVSTLTPRAICWLFEYVHWHIYLYFLGHWTSKWFIAHRETGFTNLEMQSQFSEDLSHPLTLSIHLEFIFFFSDIGLQNTTMTTVRLEPLTSGFKVGSLAPWAICWVWSTSTGTCIFLFLGHWTSNWITGHCKTWTTNLGTQESIVASPELSPQTEWQTSVSANNRSPFISTVRFLNSKLLLNGMPSTRPSVRPPLPHLT